MALGRLFPIDATYAQDSDTEIGRGAFPRPKPPSPKTHKTHRKPRQRLWAPVPGSPKTQTSAIFVSNANELTHHSLLCRGHRRQALSLHGSTIISLPLAPGRNEFGPAVVRVRAAKSAVAGDHLLHAHFVGWQSAIVMKEIARISARAPRHLSGLADAKV